MNKNAYVKLERIVVKFLEYLCIVYLALILGILFAIVITRYTAIASLASEGELVLFFFVWIVFLGSALLFKNWDHLRVDSLDRSLVKIPKAAKLTRIIVYILVLGFIVVFTKAGIDLFLIAGTRVSPLLKLPHRLWYFPLPLSGFLMLVFTVSNLIRTIKGFAAAKGNRQIR